MTTITGTGQRRLVNAPLDKKKEVLDKVMQIMSEHNATKVISGMAEGFDSAIAVAATQLGIPWIAAIPSPTYKDYYWIRTSLTKRDQSAKWDRIISAAEEVVYVCDDHQWGKANFIRNAWMMDNADMVITYQDPNSPSSGTADGIRRAKKAGLEIVSAF